MSTMEDDESWYFHDPRTGALARALAGDLTEDLEGVLDSVRSASSGSGMESEDGESWYPSVVSLAGDGGVGGMETELLPPADLEAILKDLGGKGPPIMNAISFTNYSPSSHFQFLESA